MIDQGAHKAKHHSSRWHLRCSRSCSIHNVLARSSSDSSPALARALPRSSASVRPQHALWRGTSPVLFTLHPEALFLSRFLLRHFSEQRARTAPYIVLASGPLHPFYSMGNSTSNAANANNQNNHLHPSSRRFDSPTRRTQSPSSRGGSPVPSATRVHKSLRNKKKSLELPDLASLALTPASNSPSASPHAGYRRPQRASSPIPIPISPKNQTSSFRVQNNLAAAAQLALTQNGGRGSRYKSYLSSAYPSTHSLASGDQEQGSPPRQEPQTHDFVPEVVHSTIPLALPKAEGEVCSKPEHVNVTIKWRGGGKSVVLARAGDDYWKGRQPMEYE